MQEDEAILVPCRLLLRVTFPFQRALMGMRRSFAWLKDEETGDIWTDEQGVYGCDGRMMVGVKEKTVLWLR
ncbi:MAG TPA: hypothetical protein VFV38_13620 [Ktedonobacteraceae bacterium]|nr:hypothetical protein [Ktedonobacteraceae bacterium]